jgi:carboxyl-terminal processing protease
LQDGSALLLGTSQWLTPDGRLIRKQGISPDVEVEVPLGTFLVSPDELKQMSADELAASEDAQLLKALALIQQ